MQPVSTSLTLQEKKKIIFYMIFTFFCTIRKVFHLKVTRHIETVHCTKFFINLPTEQIKKKDKKVMN